MAGGTNKGKMAGSSAQDAGFGNEVNRQYAPDTASTDAYVITLVPAPSAYYEGMEIVFKAVTANTGACSVNVNGLGAKSLVRPVAVTPSNNDILAGSIVTAVYDGTNFQMTQFIPAA